VYPVHACEPEDQVKRKAAFLAEHPEWRIGLDHSADVWRGFRDTPSGFELHVRYELEDLLDKLESLDVMPDQGTIA
jgi:hypothetical protein